MDVLDTIVVGSGCSASMAAQTLVDGGSKVTMLDVGFQNHYKPKVPDKDYLTIRREEPEQYKYFLGENAEEANRSKVAKGAQVTAARNYMLQGTDKYIPIKSDSFSPLESLGYGGLGISWGLQCWEYPQAELAKAGLNIPRMRGAYDTVSQRIGISATADSAAAYTIGDLKNFQPSPRMDPNHSLIYKKYLNKQAYFNRGVHIGRTPLALITKDIGKRKAYKYLDMDFYTDHTLSAWRPYLTVNELKKRSNFEYIGDHLVLSFSEKKDHIVVSCLNIKNDKRVNFYCRKLVLSSGALGTARIVLRSLGKSGTRLPLLSNPHTYIPCLQTAMVGKGVEKNKLGFGQLSIFIDKNGDGLSSSVASSYSYQSLMLHRIVREVPMDLLAARKILQYLTPALIIMIVQHADSQSKDKYLRLREDPTVPTNDVLDAHYKMTDDEYQTGTNNEKHYIRVMRKLNTYAIKRIKLPNGAAIHYAGTLPFSKEVKEFTLSPTGRINGTKNIYVADSSGFNYLPAAGLTFTLMANAHIVADNALKNV